MKPVPVNPVKSKIVSIAALLFATTVVGWWWYGDSIRCWIVLEDLRRFGSSVRNSDLDIDKKEKLIAAIHAVEDQIRGGKCPSYWRNTDEAVREMLIDEIDRDEVRLIVRELDRVRMQLLSRKVMTDQ